MFQQVEVLTLACFYASQLENVGIARALVALAGVAYIAIAIGLFQGKRVFSYLGANVPAVWASMGILAYVTVRPALIFLPFIATEIVIFLCCCYLIVHRTFHENIL